MGDGWRLEWEHLLGKRREEGGNGRNAERDRDKIKEPLRGSIEH